MAQYTDTRALTEINIAGLNYETIELVAEQGFTAVFQWLEFDTPNVVTWNFDIAISGAEETLLSNLLAAHDRTIWDDIQAETSLYPQGESSDMYYDASTSGLTSSTVQTAIDEVEARVGDNDLKVSADGSIDTHSDVDTTSTTPALGDKLIWNGANWIVDKAVYTLADGSVDFTDVATYNAHPSFTSDTDLVDKKYIDDALAAYSLATLQIERTTAFAATNAWVDITFDQTSLETDNTVLIINTTNTDRIDIGADGTYLITARVVPTNASSQRYDIRVRKNDTTVIPGSESFVDIYSGESHELTLNCTFSAVDGDYITLQGLAEVSGTFQANSGITITKLDGVKGIDGLDGDDGADGESAYETAVANGFIGTESQWLESLNGDDGADGDPGPAGSGSTLNVANEGTTLVTGPFEEFNFIGNDVNVAANGSNGTIADITIQSAIYQNTINVAKSGGDFTTVEAALASFSDNSSAIRYLIIVHSGIFTENNPLPLKDYVTIKSAGNDLNSRIVAANPTSNLFEVIATDVVFSYLQDLTLSGTDSTHYAVYNNKATQISCRNLTILNCGKGFYLNNTGGIFDLSTIHTIASTTMVTFSEVLAGKYFLTDYLTIDGSTITTIFRFSGSTTFANLVDLKSFESGVTTGIVIEDGAYVIGKVMHMDEMTDGIIISGDNSNGDFNSLSMHNITNDGITVLNTGTNIRIGFFGGSITTIGRYSFNVLNVNCMIVGQGYTELSKVNAVIGAQFYASIIDTTEGDEGTNIFGELHVGTPLNPSESVFGEGDSYTRGMLVYTYDGSTYTSVSADAANISGSAFTFPNTSADSAIYLASAVNNGVDYLTHQGFKAVVSTAATLGTGSFALEIWNGTTWVDAHFMVSESNAPYRPRAEKFAEEVGSFQMRYDVRLETIESLWAKTDAVGIGLPLYWLRIRIVTAITTAPIFEQFKLHSNRMEINGDGFTEFFGNARPLGTMPWTINDATAWDSSPGNIDLFVLNSQDGADYDLGVGRVENDFVTGVTDKISFGLPLPMDMDTSSPIHLEFYYMVNDSASGNLNMKTSKGITGVGDGVVRDPVLTAPTTIRDYEITDNIIPVNLNEQDLMKFFSTDIYASEGIARKAPDNDSDIITISIVRDGSNNADTYIGNVAIYQVRANYYKWSHGGYKV